MNNRVALEPKQIAAYVEAIESSGALVSPMSSEVEALVWTDYSQPQALADLLKENPQVKWVQLPFAGVDAFSDLIQLPPVFTSAKRAYSEPVAEHALALCLALGRALPQRVRAKSWGKKYADSLFDEEVLIVGGGGISQVLVELLSPFRSSVTVVRKRPNEPFSGAKVVGFEKLDSEIPKAKFVILACALTSETRMLINRSRLSSMRNDSYLVNVSRGEVIDQEALTWALTSNEILAAAVDVTYPEPLPEENPLWKLENLLITPHTADTMPIVTRLFAQRLRENVDAWLNKKQLVGIVDKNLGY